ncbi:MAG: hypothetical protein L6R36_002586 [Xanthoria steineri]|nr:MAG: hypothetical protein L6R36_002586 [Xanthoria steineri]
MFPADKHAEMYDYRLARLRITFKDDFVLHFKIVDLSSNTIVSYASWDIPRPAVPGGEALDDESAQRPPKAIYPEGCNLEMIEEFYQERDRIAKSHVNKTQDYILRVLFTHPGYQSRGLASIMLRRMLDSIDAERRRCYLEATPAGYPLYLKFGWKVVDEVRTDLAKYGAKDAPVELTPCMMRDASWLPKKTYNSSSQDNLGRGMSNVPGLPKGWRAVYDVITELRGIPPPSERQIIKFYDQILTAAYDNVLGPDTVRKTFHLGNLALQFQSRNRQQQNVTRELVIATIGILLHFAESGFVDLFKARLEHAVEDLGVYIVLAVTERTIQGFRITGGGS